MKILIIGGTRFSGRRISLEALASGHELTIFHRGGRSLCPELVESSATIIIGNRDCDQDLSALCIEKKWDITIDMCAYRPNQIDKLNRALGVSGGKYILISSISAYSEENPYDVVEAAARLVDLSSVQGEDTDTDLIAIDDITYGALKVLCEQRVTDLYSDNYIILRPSYIIGPHDYSMRFPTWVQRIQAAYVSFTHTKEVAQVEAPCPATNPMQFIDARDFALFVLQMVEADTRHVDAVHVAMKNHITFEEMLHIIRDAVHQKMFITPHNNKNNTISTDECDTEEKEMVSVSAVTFKWIPVTEAVLRTDDFPLWDSPGTPSPLNAVCSDKARQLGLQCRSLQESVWGVMDWLAMLPE